ncbi:hypothetical protein CIK64_02045 [Brevibacterium aurantiacum]|uniref:ABC3 transporter permease C-terminal domain-containing protein n=2 Tax=Brevibacterium aurantiacum TaxID=273384 RepID=A0A2A3Z9K8_BREAU|nr:hypothetical protein CIK64_02045 [Brevibacterium aurantiacum]
MLRISLKMLIRHRSSYTGLAVILILASALLGSSFSLYRSAGLITYSSSYLSRNEIAELLSRVVSAQTFTGLLVVIAAGTTFLLTTQNIRFVLDGRRREFALTRLLGATTAQINRTVIIETCLLVGMCSILGAALSPLLIQPYVALMERSSNWPKGYEANTDPVALIVTVFGVLCLALLAAVAAMFRQGQIGVVDSTRKDVSGRSGLSIARMIFGAVGAGLLFVSFGPISANINFQVGTILACGGATLLAIASLPLLVPALARLFAYVFSLGSAGARMVARGHIAHDLHRSISLAAPTVLFVTLSACFGMMAQTGRAESSAGYFEVLNVDTVVSGPSLVDSNAKAEQLDKSDASVVRKSAEWSWDQNSVPMDQPLDIVGVDPDSLDYHIPVHAEEGSFADVHGSQVAAFQGVANIGDTLRIRSDSGSTKEVHVVAVLASSSFLNGSLVVDSRTFGTLNGESEEDTIFVPSSARSGTRLPAETLETAFPEATVESFNTWAQRNVESSISTQRVAIVALLSGAGFLLIAGISQYVFNTVRGRRLTITTLNNMGIGAGATARAFIAEVLSILMSAVTISAGAIWIIYHRMGLGLHESGSRAEVIVPYGEIAISILVCMIVCSVAAAFGVPSPGRVSPGTGFRESATRQ